MEARFLVSYGDLLQPTTDYLTIDTPDGCTEDEIMFRGELAAQHLAQKVHSSDFVFRVKRLPTQ